LIFEKDPDLRIETEEDLQKGHFRFAEISKQYLVCHEGAVCRAAIMIAR